MGMFDKDKEIGRQLTQVFKFGDEFILWNARESGTVNTKIGEARKTELLVSKLESPDAKFELGTLSSAIADKVAEAEAGDFPAVVQLLQVPTDKGNDATVIQFVREYM